MSFGDVLDSIDLWRRGVGDVQRSSPSKAASFQELPDGQNGGPTVGAELSKILIPCHEIFGIASHGTFEELVVRGIPLDDREVPPYLDCLDQGEQFTLD